MTVRRILRVGGHAMGSMEQKKYVLMVVSSREIKLIETSAVYYRLTLSVHMVSKT